MVTKQKLKQGQGGRWQLGLEFLRGCCSDNERVVQTVSNWSYIGKLVLKTPFVEQKSNAPF